MQIYFHYELKIINEFYFEMFQDDTHFFYLKKKFYILFFAFEQKSFGPLLKCLAQQKEIMKREYCQMRICSKWPLEIRVNVILAYMKMFMM